VGHGVDALACADNRSVLHGVRERDSKQPATWLTTAARSMISRFSNSPSSTLYSALSPRRDPPVHSMYTTFLRASRRRRNRFLPSESVLYECQNIFVTRAEGNRTACVHRAARQFTYRVCVCVVFIHTTTRQQIKLQGHQTWRRVESGPSSYLLQGMAMVMYSLCLSVCLSVCPQDNYKVVEF